MFLTEIRLLTGFGLKREAKRYNVIKNSPYRVPNTVKYQLSLP